MAPVKRPLVLPAHGRALQRLEAVCQARYRIYGHRLRYWRVMRGLSLEHVGQLTGLKPRRVRNLEIADVDAPRLGDYIKIAVALDIDLEQLFAHWLTIDAKAVPW